MRDLRVEVHSLDHLKWLGNPGTDALGLLELRRLIRRLAPDIVHLHSFKAGALGRLACAGLPVKVVFTAHGWVFTPGSSLIRRTLGAFIEWCLSWMTDRIVVVSQFDLNSARRNGISVRKLVMIRNGVPGLPEDEYRAKVERLNSRDPTAAIRLVMVARFAPPKAQSLLLRALSRLEPAEVVRTRTTFVGDGPELKESMDLAQSLGLAPHTHFAGLIASREVDAYLNDAEVLVLASFYEGMPLSVLEGMSAGCAILASNIGALQELIGGTGCGALVDNDPDAWSGALRNILNGDLRSMCVRSRQVFEARGTIDQQFGATVALYDSLLNA
jgi:glycosyltransferase involved in cell wall biosynthesis